MTIIEEYALQITFFGSDLLCHEWFFLFSVIVDADNTGSDCHEVNFNIGALTSKFDTDCNILKNTYKSRLKRPSVLKGC